MKNELEEPELINVKGTVSVNSSESPSKDSNAWFTMVLRKALSDKTAGSSTFLSDSGFKGHVVIRPLFSSHEGSNRLSSTIGGNREMDQLYRRHKCQI